MPNHGDKVWVKPDPDHCQKGAKLSMVLSAPGRFLPVDGDEVVWSPFLDVRLRTGEIVIPVELKPRELAPGEMLAAAELPPGSTAVELAPGSDTEKVAGPLPAGMVPVEVGHATIAPGESASLTLDTTQPVKE